MTTSASADSLIPLLSASARGDQHAFKSLYDRTSAHLYGICLRILRREDWAEDALQEAFVKVWHHASDYHPEKGTVMTWLISIVRYRALDVLRKRDNQVDLDDEALAQIPDDALSPLDRMIQGNERAALENCMGELQPDHKQSIALAFLHGLTHDELTRQLQKPLGTVKSWIRRGLQALKRCLES
jgi:RNA polymerase sigma-70 factor, ECF subfamily